MCHLAEYWELSMIQFSDGLAQAGGPHVEAAQLYESQIIYFTVWSQPFTNNQESLGDRMGDILGVVY